MMTVYAVERNDDDAYYNGYTVALFSSEEKAQAYIDSIPEYMQEEYCIETYIIDGIEKSGY